MEVTNKVVITLDGKPVECEPDELLIAAAQRSGVYIPRFCWHPRMDPVGACRMCLVRIEGGSPKPQTACTTPVRDGMVVHTQFGDAEVREAQEGVLEFLLINHPLDCPICDRGGECPLQDQTQDYGPDDSRFIEPKRRFPKPVPISPLVNLDRERCILCFRCTRFCEEISGDVMISTMQRGPRSYIYPFEGDAFDSYFSGNTIEICPVGALTSAPYRFQARPWDLRQTPSVCNLCASGCNVNLSVRVADGKLVRASQFTNEAVNEEWLCDKGRFGHAYVSSPDRITQPWIRIDGELRPAGWDEAFKHLASRLAGIIETNDPDRAGLILGASLTNEDAYTAQKFARMVLRTNSIDHRLDPGMDAAAVMPPQLTYDDVVNAEHVVTVNLDSREELPILYLRTRVAVTKHGVRLSIVHPRRIAGTQIASTHIQPLPGYTAAIGAALTSALGQPVAAGTDAMASLAGVPTDQITALAAAMRDTNTVIVLGPGVASDVNAIRAWRAVARICNAKIGWAPRRSGEYGLLASGAHPDLLPGWRRVDDQQAREHLETLWGTTLNEKPGSGAVDILRRAAAGNIDALWLVGADVLDVPDSRLGAEALYGAKFVVLQTVVADDQIEFADVVLPAAAFAEREGTLTNWEGRRQPLAQAVEPPGSARADYAILAEAARRFGRPIGCRKLSDVSAELEALMDGPTPAFGGSEVGVHIAAQPRPDSFPLRLMTYRLLYDAGSRIQHTPEVGQLTAGAFVELNTADANGVADGASVRVTSNHGSIVVTARVGDDIRPGAAFVPYAQPGAGARELLSIEDPFPFVRVEAL